MNCFIKILLAFCFLYEPLHAQSTDHWRATDGLGRELPGYGDTGPKREGKYVGVFYYVWVGYHGDTVYDITKILADNPDSPLDNSDYGPHGAFHFWGEPEYGYYDSNDPWVIRNDLQMLTNADVDFIFFDVTNAITYLETIENVCEISSQMRKQGISTPDIAFLTNTNSGETMNEIYDKFYAKDLYIDQWFYWKGKPLILGDFSDSELRNEVKNFFTIKYSWAWTNTEENPNHWQWLDKYPQDWGWSKAPSIPEQLSVSAAHHPANPLGKSFNEGEQPHVDENYLTEFTDHGLQFQEQWNRVHEIDPDVVMITQWNEWIAQRFIWNNGDGKYGGRPISDGETFFVDVFSQEFNRDIAPMKGGYTDNYYYQMVANIRKFKGMNKPSEFSLPKSIDIDGVFGEWSDVQPVYRDPIGDVLHRNFQGYDPETKYTNFTGRNDILESRVTFDDDSLYFYVKTNQAITPSTDTNWMLLFIDADQNKKSGWEGYDWLINYPVISKNKTTLKQWDGNSWENIKTVNYRVKGKEMEISLSREDLKMNKNEPRFYFKWADNPRHIKDISAFFIHGDAAPDRRFNYNFNIQ